MNAITTARPPINQPAGDRKILEWLEKQFAKFGEDGYGRKFADQVLTRFAQLVDGEENCRRCLETVADAHKLAMAQVQFAQQAIRQLERQVEAAQSRAIENGSNGATPPAASAPQTPPTSEPTPPGVDLHGL